jgi:thiamine-phosphate pyrophosphorylase
MQRGLYLITPDGDDADVLHARVAPLLPFATCLQYRNKRAAAVQRRVEAAMLAGLCRAAGVRFIVNDDARLAADVGADGVHLGEHDGPPSDARRILGPAAIVGVSCYDELRRAHDAVALGADYVAFGAFYPSATKPNARRATPALLRDAAPLGVPRVAIGGITPDNARPLVDAGADLIAIVGGVFDAPDPVAAARACRSLYTLEP